MSVDSLSAEVTFQKFQWTKLTEGGLTTENVSAGFERVSFLLGVELAPASEREALLLASVFLSGQQKRETDRIKKAIGRQ